MSTSAEDAAAEATRIATENARAIAAKLSAAVAPVADADNAAPAAEEAASELGKRKGRWGDDSSSALETAEATAAAIANAMSASLTNVDNKKRAKISVPDTIDSTINIMGVLIGPKGATLKAMQDKSGAKISIRGKGSNKDPNSTEPDSDEPLHVVVEGSDEAVALATREIEGILHSPDVSTGRPLACCACFGCRTFRCFSAHFVIMCLTDLSLLPVHSLTCLCLPATKGGQPPEAAAAD
jgi:KH domain